MQFVILFFCFISTCYCAVDFYDRPRNFSVELLYYTQLETSGHVVISPFGIWTLMTGIALGAKGNSYKQLSEAFRLPRKSAALAKGYSSLVSAVQNSARNGVTLMSMNFMFIDNDFDIDAQFKASFQRDYGAMIQKLDFGDPNSAKIANRFIQNTGAKVSNVLRSDDFADSRMILTNVISFKGLWSLPFNETETQEEAFYDENRQVIGRVNMMSQKGEFAFSNVHGLKAFALELSYGSEKKYSMIVLLPYGKTKIAEMYKKLEEVSLKDIITKLKSDVEINGMGEVEVKLPRFKISTNVVMNKPLNDMGVVDIFQPNVANFERMTNEKIFVSAIVHKAEIEVTESGTVATASSTATFADRISSPSFYANRPFMYVIVEKSTSSVIFSGIYSQPSVF